MPPSTATRGLFRNHSSSIVSGTIARLGVATPCQPSETFYAVSSAPIPVFAEKFPCKQGIVCVGASSGCARARRMRFRPVSGSMAQAQA